MKTKSNKVNQNNVKANVITSRKERRLMKLQNKAEKKNKNMNKKFRKAMNAHKMTTSNNISQTIFKPRKDYPWLSHITVTAKGIERLHHEIHDFWEHIKPKEKENLKRKQTIQIFTEMIESKWKGWRVRIFGSFPVDLHLSDSDIDMVVFNDPTSVHYRYLTDVQQLHLIHDYLQRIDLCNEVRYVDARVPIVKVRTCNGIDIDISYIYLLI
jgi:DNA polymerase sigma